MKTNPLRTITVVYIIFFAVIAVGRDALLAYYMNNVVLNGIIVGAMAFGMIYILYASIRLTGVVNKLKLSTKHPENHSKIMKRNGGFSWIMAIKDVEVVRNWSPENPFHASDVDEIMSSIKLRIAEVRNLSNYFSGVLIILGLLGTFLGLLETIKSIAEVFSGPSLKFLVGNKEGGGSTGGDDVLQFFDAIAKPLAGMGVAFSSSLFGLSGSLTIGMLAFIASRTQSFFLFDIFDWLKERTMETERESLNRGTAVLQGRTTGLMGSLVSSGRENIVKQRAVNTQPEQAASGSIVGNLETEKLNEILERLEKISQEAVEKNGLLAQAALKLGEGLAMEQKRLADIATYQQQSSISLVSIDRQGSQQIQVLNQLVEAANSNDEREEFRQLASQFYRSFDRLTVDVKSSHNEILERVQVEMDELKDHSESHDQSYSANITAESLKESEAEKGPVVEDKDKA